MQENRDDKNDAQGRLSKHISSAVMERVLVLGHDERG